jgi:hypothetical protein
MRSGAPAAHDVSLRSTNNVTSVSLRSDPRLGTRLHRVPGTTHGRSIAEVEGIQVVDGHVVKQGRCKDIDPLSDFPMVVSDHLRTQEAICFPIPGDTAISIPM